MASDRPASSCLWKLLPAVRASLKDVSVREPMDPVPVPVFKEVSTMQEVGRAVVEQTHEFFDVSGDGR